MKIFWIPEIDDRPFGRAAVRLDALREWAKAREASLPQTNIDLDEFEAVHLESLLNAVSLGVAKMRERDILDVAMKLMNDPATPALHPELRQTIEEGTVDAARWFVGEEVGAAWRRYMREAIDSGALPVIDAMTGLPLHARVTPPPQTTAPKPATAVNHKDKVLPRDGADVFINAALEAVKPATDVATVWAELQKMAGAKEKPGTLMEMVDGALKYLKNGVVTFYTRDALDKKLKRRKAP